MHTKTHTHQFFVFTFQAIKVKVLLCALAASQKTPARSQFNLAPQINNLKCVNSANTHACTSPVHSRRGPSQIPNSRNVLFEIAF